METQKPLAQRITQGPFTLAVNCLDAPNKKRIAIILNSEEWRANSELMLEAFNTTQETGLSPAQLAQRVAYAQRVGLNVALGTSADCPEGRLQHEYIEGSELDRIFDEWSHSIGWEAGEEKLKARILALESVVKDLKSDLFYQIEAKHGAEKASKYPSILKASEILG